MRKNLDITPTFLTRDEAAAGQKQAVFEETRKSIRTESNTAIKREGGVVCEPLITAGLYSSFLEALPQACGKRHLLPLLRRSSFRLQVPSSGVLSLQRVCIPHYSL